MASGGEARVSSRRLPNATVANELMVAMLMVEMVEMVRVTESLLVMVRWAKGKE